MCWNIRSDVCRIQLVISFFRHVSLEPFIFPSHFVVVPQSLSSTLRYVKFVYQLLSPLHISLLSRVCLRYSECLVVVFNTEPCVLASYNVLVLHLCCPRGTYFIYTLTYSRILKCRVCNPVSSTIWNHSSARN